MPAIQLHNEVREALDSGRPVVALESAVITAGLPPATVNLPAALKVDGWRTSEPVNLELARAMERTVRTAGAIPATVAVIEGSLRIGLDDADLQRLATEGRVGKASITDLAWMLAQPGATAGTTVSGTLAALRAAQFLNVKRSSAGPLPIAVFATGGIGGVHRDWQKQPDVSADLRAIADTPVCVVCSGAKSILDLPATLEALEALNVPTLGYRTHVFPQFHAAGTGDLRVRLKVDDAREAAVICRSQWCDLNLPMGVLLAQPAPQALALDAVEMTLAIAAAERAAHHQKIAGAQRTPFMLEEIARLTENRSLAANLALLVGNARLAAEVALAMWQLP
jgi:pseudouridine-5'-phosphate glycosidase